MPTALAAILLVACAASLEPAQNAALDTATIVPTTPSLGTLILRSSRRLANRAFRLPGIYRSGFALSKPLTPAGLPSSISPASPSPAPARTRPYEAASPASLHRKHRFDRGSDPHFRRRQVSGALRPVPSQHGLVGSHADRSSSLWLHEREPFHFRSACRVHERRTTPPLGSSKRLPLSALDASGI